MPSLLTTAAIAPPVGGLLGAMYEFRPSAEEAHVRLYRAAALKSDPRLRQREDAAIMGALLGSLLIPAVVYRRVTLFRSVPAGAGLGCAAGVGVHYYRSIFPSRPPPIISPSA